MIISLDFKENRTHSPSDKSTSDLIAALLSVPLVCLRLLKQEGIQDNVGKWLGQNELWLLHFKVVHSCSTVTMATKVQAPLLGFLFQTEPLPLQSP